MRTLALAGTASGAQTRVKSVGSSRSSKRPAEELVGDVGAGGPGAHTVHHGLDVRQTRGGADDLTDARHQNLGIPVRAAVGAELPGAVGGVAAGEQEGVCRAAHDRVDVPATERRLEIGPEKRADRRAVNRLAVHADPPNRSRSGLCAPSAAIT